MQDADILVWDPDKSRTISAKTHHHAVDFNIFEGMNVHGIAEYVLSNGKVVVDEGQLKVCQGSGRYIKNPAYSPYVYDKVETNAVNRMMREVGVHRTEEDFQIDDNVEEPDMVEKAPQAVANQQKSSFDLKGHPAQPEPGPELELGQPQSPQVENSQTRPTIDSKPQIRVRAPPGGRSSIFF